MINNLKNKKIIVTGCAGFIGSNLVDKLLKYKNSIIGIDNLSTGKKKFIEKALKNKKTKHNIASKVGNMIKSIKQKIL